MDTNYIEFSVTGAEVSSYPTVSALPANLFSSLEFDAINSSNSPYSTHSDTDTLYAYKGNLEQQSSPDNFYVSTPSSNSLPYYEEYLQQSRPTSFCRQDNLLVRSSGLFSLHSADHNQHIRRALLEMESVLMGPDDDEEVATSEPCFGENKRSRAPIQGSRGWNHESRGSPLNPSDSVSSSSEEHKMETQYKAMENFALQGFPPNNLKQLLVACATALSEYKLDKFEKLVLHARASVSITGDPIQRVGAYMLEGLIARKELSGTNIYHSLKCNEPDSKDLMSYMHILYEICPYLKFGYMAANGAIAEACKNENRIHIIDFQISQGTQWMTLLQALAARPCGAPHVRITGIDDPVSKHARGDSLALVGRRLAAISVKFNIPVEFHPIPVFAPDIKRDMLDVRPGEALVVNFPLQLHHTPDESVDVSNPRDGLLRLVKSLSPKVVTLVEQESNTNTAPFLQRFIEALDYYSAMFESIDVTMPRDRKERINVEEHCLARDIVNIIACEGKERVERHELLGKWRLRFMMAGFRAYPLSSYVNSVIRGLLRCYSENYTLVEKDGAMLLGWKDRNLVSASAWH
ncbi:chitin-inducible gibberellin-responsive protein 1-like [Dorcoceras hygrometricum]|uniref:Chitin-inducible gibberellin-responsive protein 1-like n=1 Tax=Dorcoceras hygrometricum TaxID=472368 RepID=A0A2Z7DEX9_9LAMI|nr:chitin-inducible gibberellin-responsive protein 1-like [Dorcoceras hygrometricum]